MKSARWALLPLSLALLASSGCGESSSNAETTAVAAKDSQASGAVLNKNFDDLKFEMELTDKYKREMLTPEIEKLFGRRIRIPGYMFPTYKDKGLKQFVLVRDNLECCFGPGAALFDCILVHMQPGKTAEYSERPVRVQGKLSYEEFHDVDGTVRAIFRLDGESVEY